MMTLIKPVGGDWGDDAKVLWRGELQNAPAVGSYVQINTKNKDIVAFRVVSTAVSLSQDADSTPETIVFVEVHGTSAIKQLNG